MIKGTKSSEITGTNFPKQVLPLSNSKGFYCNDKSVSKNHTISRGMLYILQLSHLPLTTFIVKEASKRKNKDSKGFVWCFCIKDMNSSFVQFKKLLSFVDKSVDLVKGIHIKTESGRYDEKLHVNFVNYCKEAGVKHFNFSYIEHSKHFQGSIGLQISNLVNFGEDYIDFVICHYNNRSYYYIENHPLYDLIMNVESNIVFSKEECHEQVLTKYIPEENPILDADLLKLTAEKIGIGEKFQSEEKLTFIIDYLKVDTPTIRKRDFLMYLERKNRGEKTFAERTDDENLVLLTEDNEASRIEDTKEEIVKKDEAEVVKDLLKQEMPNFSKIKDFADNLKLWKSVEPNLRKIIINIKNNPVLAVDIQTVHNEITDLVLTDKKYFTDAFKDSFIKYIRCIYKKNDAKSYEDAYQEIYDLLPLSDLSSAKNIKELKKVFESSNKEIIRDILECPFINASTEELEELHLKIIKDVSDENYPFFDRLKKTLISYKKSADEQNSEEINIHIDNLRLLTELDNLFVMNDIEEVNKFFVEISPLAIKNLLSIPNIGYSEWDVQQLHETILKGLVQKSPYYDEMIQLVKIYLDAVVNKHVHDIHLCKKEFYEFIQRIEDVIKSKKKIDYSSQKSKEELFKSWKNDERHLIYISNDVDGLTRQELKHFHNEVYKTFAGDLTSFYEMKKQLSTYTNSLSSGNFKEIKNSMNNFMAFMKKENLQDQKKELLVESKREAPNFRAIKDRKQFEEDWLSYIKLKRNTQIFSLEDCPLNEMKIEFLNDSIKKHLRNHETDFEWFKTLVQNFAMSVFKQDYSTMLDSYNAVNRYIPEKQVV